MLQKCIGIKDIQTFLVSNSSLCEIQQSSVKYISHIKMIRNLYHITLHCGLGTCQTKLVFVQVNTKGVQTKMSDHHFMLCSQYAHALMTLSSFSYSPQVTRVYSCTVLKSRRPNTYRIWPLGRDQLPTVSPNHHLDQMLM